MGGAGWSWKGGAGDAGVGGLEMESAGRGRRKKNGGGELPQVAPFPPEISPLSFRRERCVRYVGLASPRCKSWSCCWFRLTSNGRVPTFTTYSKYNIV